jgi:hypothetical protein
MLGQMARSEKAGLPAYRGVLGTKCAIGCLISDEEYDKIIENYTFEEVGYYYLAQGNSRLSSYLIEDREPLNDMRWLMLRELVKLHDEWKTKYWRAQLRRIAKRYRVVTDI